MKIRLRPRKNSLLLIALPVVLAVATLAALRTGRPASAIQFAVSVDPAAHGDPVSGRILLLLSKTERFAPGVNGTPVFGMNVDDLQPGSQAILDEKAFGYPIRSLGDLPDGDYYVQAWLNVYTTFRRSDGKVVKLHMDQGEGQNWRRSPGNLYSSPVRVRIGGDAPAPGPIVLNQVVPPIPPYVDTQNLKHLKIRSELLTRFWGHEMFLGANILLPKGYYEHPETRYPVYYSQGHFPRGSVGSVSRDPDSSAGSAQGAEGRPRFIQVTFEHACPYYDDSYGVNSENVGPYGDALITELIPAIEKNYRTISQPWARLLGGGSTGGWISLALQLFHPDFFGGTWSFCPDPVDFHKYQIVNLYDDANAYYTEHEWTRVPRGCLRDTSGNVLQTMDQENLYEEAIGDRCRSGGQWAIWNAVFAPVAEDGYPKPLWDPLTGRITQDVVRWAGERYDLRRYLEKNWSTLGPKLAGKIHVYVGRMDNYYLNEACYLLQDSLERMTDPPYGGEFRYGDRAGHGWSPFKADEFIGVLSDQVLKNSPDGNKDWIY